MSQVETIALWTGLFASIAGIVLSIVATLFAIWVNQGATEVNNQTIRSLQKIESSVDQLSRDTRELITAAWNRMLGGMAGTDESGSPDSDTPERISGGIASEIRTELTTGMPAASAAKLERIDQAIQDLQKTVSTQLRARSNTRFDSFDSLVQRISVLPLEARALLSILTKGGHLERDQYLTALNSEILHSPVQELRNAGLLVPLQGLDENKGKVPVYWLPGTAKQVRLANQFLADVPRELIERIRSALEVIGYEARPE